MLLAYCGYVATYISAITNRHSDGSVGVVHSNVLYVAPASLQAARHALKRWEWLCKGLMHMLCTAAILRYYKGSTPGPATASIDGRGSM